jgi:hypothetical protein
VLIRVVIEFRFRVRFIQRTVNQGLDCPLK